MQSTRRAILSVISPLSGTNTPTQGDSVGFARGLC